MGDKSKISWTDATWNPVTGCSKVSPGCANCYAEALSLRQGWSEKPWTQENAAENVVLHPERLDQPLRWRKPRRIFVVSMGDLFHERVPDCFIDEVFSIMARASHHQFQVLTKRPGRMRDYLTSQVRRVELAVLINIKMKTGENVSIPWPLPNVWLGVSVENQHWADERIPLLLETPAAVRFISAEPLLSAVDLGCWLDRKGASLECAICRRTKVPIGRSVPMVMAGSICDRDCLGYNNDPKPDQLWPGESAQEFGYSNEPFIDWVIAGGESGSGHRPMNVDWARSIRDQCVAAGVPFFFKQGSGPRPGMHRELDGRRWDEYP